MTGTLGGHVIGPRLVTDEVYDFLEGEILSGRLEGGTHLRVRQLADMVGTSVMPVREAISRLEDSGLALREPHRGAVVKSFSVAELIKIYDVRQMLEPEAARAGTPHLTPQDLARMDEAMSAQRRALDRGSATEALKQDENFLRTIYRRSGNDILCNLIDSLWKQSHIYRVTVTGDDVRNGGIRTFDCNVRIIEAARRGDADEVAAWSRKTFVKALHTLTHIDRESAASSE